MIEKGGRLKGRPSISILMGLLRKIQNFGDERPTKIGQQYIKRERGEMNAGEEGWLIIKQNFMK